MKSGKILFLNISKVAQSKRDRRLRSECHVMLLEVLFIGVF